MAEGQLQVVVGINLRRVRRQLGYSQESFGEHVGWHRTFVGAVERGERNLTLRTVERLALQLGIHPLELLFDRDGVAIMRASDDTPHFVDRPALRTAADRGRGASAPGTRRPRPNPA